MENATIPLQQTKPELMDDTPFKLIRVDHMLITAGTTGSFNAMTASRDALGILRDKKVCFCKCLVK